MKVSQIGESNVGAIKKYWTACNNSIVKKKNTPDARAVLEVFDQIHHDEKRPIAAKVADISIEKHILITIQIKLT